MRGQRNDAKKHSTLCMVMDFVRRYGLRRNRLGAARAGIYKAGRDAFHANGDDGRGRYYYLFDIVAILLAYRLAQKKLGSMGIACTVRHILAGIVYRSQLVSGRSPSLKCFVLRVNSHGELGFRLCLHRGCKALV